MKYETRPYHPRDLEGVTFRPEDEHEARFAGCLGTADYAHDCHGRGQPVRTAWGPEGLLGVFGVDGDTPWMALSPYGLACGLAVVALGPSWIAPLLPRNAKTLVAVREYRQHQFLIRMGFEPCGVVVLETDPSYHCILFRRP